MLFTIYNLRWFPQDIGAVTSHMLFVVRIRRLDGHFKGNWRLYLRHGEEGPSHENRNNPIARRRRQNMYLNSRGPIGDFEPIRTFYYLSVSPATLERCPGYSLHTWGAFGKAVK